MRPIAGPRSAIIKRLKAAANMKSSGRKSNRNSRKPPRGMYINHDDIVVLATAANKLYSTSTSVTIDTTAIEGDGAKTAETFLINSFGNDEIFTTNDELLATMEREIITLRTRVRSPVYSYFKFFLKFVSDNSFLIDFILISPSDIYV